MDKIKFGTDGWRAIIADTFTVTNVARVSEATAKWTKDNYDSPSIVLGHDCRFAGELFAHTAADLNDPVANLKYRYTVREDGWKLILPYLPNEDVTLMIRGQQADWMTNDVELYNVIDDPLFSL